MLLTYVILVALIAMIEGAHSKYPAADEPVIVVGAGLAGLSAALEAVHEGASVILIEAEKNVGGNSAKASSGIAACNTEAQRLNHINDSTDRFYSDTMAAGDRENDPILVDQLVHNSKEAVDFLVSHGADLSDVVLAGGHSVKRVHRNTPVKEGRATNVGYAIISAVRDQLNLHAEQNPEKVKIKLGTEVVGLVTWNDFVTGVRVRKDDSHIEEISGKAVVLATGGFSNDHSAQGSLLAEFAPEKLKFPTTNGPWASGRGVKMARAMGAGLVGMNDVQLNEKGERFGNELGRRDYLTDRILHHCAEDEQAGGAHTAFMLMTNQSADDFGRAAFGFYAYVKGFFKKFDNVAELAKYMNVDEAKLRKTLVDYNKYVTSDDPNKKDEFGKVFFPASFDPDDVLFVAKITPAIHYTMGGLKIDKQAYVFNEFAQKPFKGLLAAGEVTGGVHGRNRLAGNSLLECVVYGRIAGRNAARTKYSDADAVIRSDL
ncbi:Fumarate reductase [Toxocara canis]|uniref:Fumarate reductase n=1 Tax=Toxocara canis TaxID=6265 RepID=A0A0B2W139_TOXCA|nr:Fumarate reductase [Toxocara canis]